jgi:hypothetical protein
MARSKPGPAGVDSFYAYGAEILNRGRRTAAAGELRTEDESQRSTLNAQRSTPAGHKQIMESIARHAFSDKKIFLLRTRQLFLYNFDGWRY